ncbi:MAG: Gfo/Idh/MocA family oxidoreductase [Synergistaceae bacterium]|nr:Gfo/Idh/MocA family oxidoreductase [Synergistaceae bacterium]
MLKFGIIGSGLRGKLFAETIKQNDYAGLQAMCDVNAETANEARKAFGVASYTDFKKMLDEEKLDAVVVATPDFLHREPVICAAEHGVHVLVEKPFATLESDSEAMIASIEKSGITCMVAFENRWNLPIITAKNQIDSGALGDILNINTRLNNMITSPTSMLKWSKNSSVGWFLFPHILDMTMWFNGGKKVDKIYAVGTKKKLISMGYDIYDTLQATLTFADGTHATLTSTWILPESMPLGYDLKFEIIGSENAMYIDTQAQSVFYAGSDKMYNLHSLSTPIDGYLTACPCFMLRHFINCLREGRKPEADERLGAYNTRIICAIHRSADNGGEIIKL